MSNRSQTRLLCYLAIVWGVILVALPFAIGQAGMRLLDIPAGLFLIAAAAALLRRDRRYRRRRRVRLLSE